MHLGLERALELIDGAGEGQPARRRRDALHGEPLRLEPAVARATSDGLAPYRAPNSDGLSQRWYVGDVGS